MNWEDWKKLQKENAAKAAAVVAEEENQMREYRAQLDADRNERLSTGTNNAHLRTQVAANPHSLPISFTCCRLHARLKLSLQILKASLKKKGTRVLCTALCESDWLVLQESSVMH